MPDKTTRHIKVAQNHLDQIYAKKFAQFPKMKNALACIYSDANWYGLTMDQDPFNQSYRIDRMQKNCINEVSTSYTLNGFYSGHVAGREESDEFDSEASADTLYKLVNYDPVKIHDAYFADRLANDLKTGPVMPYTLSLGKIVNAYIVAGHVPANDAVDIYNNINSPNTKTKLLEDLKSRVTVSQAKIANEYTDEKIAMTSNLFLNLKTAIASIEKLAI